MEVFRGSGGGLGGSGGGRRLGGSKHEALEAIEGSEAASTKLWRQQDALEAVECYGGDQRLWRGSKAPEAVSTKLWRWQEAMGAVEGSGGGQRLWRGSKGSGGRKHKALEVAGSSGGIYRPSHTCHPPVAACHSPLARHPRPAPRHARHRPPTTILLMPAICPPSLCLGFSSLPA